MTPSPVSLAASIVLLRVVVAGVFLAHAIVRVVGGTIERFAGFLDAKGLVFGTAMVWGITALEIVGGALLAAGYFKRVLSMAFFIMLGIGIVLIHAAQGWFVGEHGTGGMEYSIVLMAALIVIGASGDGRGGRISIKI